MSLFHHDKDPQYQLEELDARYLYCACMYAVNLVTGQNVPSQNIPKSERSRSKRPKVKTSQVKMSQVKKSPSQNVPMLVYGKFGSYGLQTHHPETYVMEAYMIGWLVCVV